MVVEVGDVELAGEPIDAESLGMAQRLRERGELHRRAAVPGRLDPRRKMSGWPKPVLQRRADFVCSAVLQAMSSQM